MVQEIKEGVRELKELKKLRELKTLVYSQKYATNLLSFNFLVSKANDNFL